MKSEQVLFGERLRAALKSAGYAESPTEIARILPRFGGDAATPQAISSWLHGKSMPRQRSLRALAKMLRVEPTTLQYGTSDASGRRVREPQAEFRISAQDQHAVDAFWCCLCASANSCANSSTSCRKLRVRPAVSSRNVTP
jgi:transcriptional regulator with XRE-family HTH domain